MGRQRSPILPLQCQHRLDQFCWIKPSSLISCLSGTPVSVNLWTLICCIQFHWSTTSVSPCCQPAFGSCCSSVAESLEAETSVHDPASTPPQTHLLVLFIPAETTTTGTAAPYVSHTPGLHVPGAHPYVAPEAFNFWWKKRGTVSRGFYWLICKNFWLMGYECVNK